MKDIARSPRCTSSTTHVRPEARCLDLERPVVQDSGNNKCAVVPEIEDDQNDLELTLGPRSYYHKKIKASEPAFASDSGPSFSSSSSGSSHVRGRRSTIGRDQDLQKWAGLESNQDRLNNNSPPWFFQALSLNMTWLVLIIEIHPQLIGMVNLFLIVACFLSTTDSVIIDCMILDFN